MNADRLRACLVVLRWTGADLARALDCEHTTVRRWLAGSNVPGAVAEWLEHKVENAKQARPPPQGWKRIHIPTPYEPPILPLTEEGERTRRRKHKRYVRTSMYRANSKGATGSHSAVEVERLFNKQKGKCVNCLCSIVYGYHVDHIQALSRGGSNDISNIQLLCPPCNIRKQAKDPFKWALENGRLL